MFWVMIVAILLVLLFIFVVWMLGAGNAAGADPAATLWNLIRSFLM